MEHCPDSKVQGANIGPIWGRQDPGGPYVGPMNFVSGCVCYFSSMVSRDILYHIESYDLFWLQRNAKSRLIMVMLVVISSATQCIPTRHSLISFNYKVCYMMTLQIKWYKLQVEISLVIQNMLSEIAIEMICFNGIFSLLQYLHLK